jgi:hypothetical protein
VGAVVSGTGAVHIKTGGTTRGLFDSAGAAITGTLSASGLINGAVGAYFPSITGAPSGSNLEIGYDSGNNIGVLQAYNRTGSAWRAIGMYGLTSNHYASGSLIGSFSSTGLAVTGALSCTGDATLSALVMMPAVYNNTTGGGANLLVAGDGGNRLYRSTSSRKYKEDIIDYTSGLPEVLKLRPVFYKGKNKEADGDKQFAGLIAEEVDEVGLKEFVVYDKDGSPDALDYSHMVALAFKAIQEQDVQIKSLTARLAALESK